MTSPLQAYTEQATATRKKTATAVVAAQKAQPKVARGLGLPGCGGRGLGVPGCGGKGMGVPCCGGRVRFIATEVISTVTANSVRPTTPKPAEGENCKRKTVSIRSPHVSLRAAAERAILFIFY